MFIVQTDLLKPDDVTTQLQFRISGLNMLQMITVPLVDQNNSRTLPKASLHVLLLSIKINHPDNL